MDHFTNERGFNCCCEREALRVCYPVFVQSSFIPLSTTKEASVVAAHRCIEGLLSRLHSGLFPTIFVAKQSQGLCRTEVQSAATLMAVEGKEERKESWWRELRLLEKKGEKKSGGWRESQLLEKKREEEKREGKNRRR